MMNELTAVSPIDGRYRGKTEELTPYFSEYGLIKYRVHVEIEYFILLSKQGLPQLPELSSSNQTALRDIVTNFSEKDAQRIKDTEKVTNHDVKAVEYFIKEELDKLNLSEYKEFVHFGLTSQDINNTSFPLMLKDALNEVVIPYLKEIINTLDKYASEWSSIPMLARTHGQPASPTKLGKEMTVFTERVKKQLELFEAIPFSAKFGGATGNFNAHLVAYPKNDWIAFGNEFVDSVLGLSRSQHTTQIEHYDNMAAHFDTIKRINTVLIDLSRDFWHYISIDYFTQKVKKNEVGSSAMPHKVNPIDFENAEGNLGMANAMFEFLSAKLPISRLQRDLTDSTVLRNIGSALGHCLIAFQSLSKGLGKVALNEGSLEKDLEDNWAVAAEAIQTILRREAYPNPYEALKELTRTGKKIDKEAIKNFILTLNVDEGVRNELLAITPHNYTGVY
ncbi:MAG: adenylosuccinate lyase [Cyclobacteriaceae bacterium]